MKDVQMEHSRTDIDIDKVGVKGVVYPIKVLVKNNKNKDIFQTTVANINMYVDLPSEFRGTHMSRFLEILNKFRGEITRRTLPKILKEMIETLNAGSSHMEVEFTYFIEKKAPVTGSNALMGYMCRFLCSCNQEEDFILEVKIPITTLCPCSREISDRGAHNQRGVVTIGIRSTELIWIEDLIDMVEACGSSTVYSILKREDEKFITEQAYDNPRFVEDVTRDVTKKLEEDNNITWFSVEVESFESIHNHSAYASIKRNKKCS